MTMQEIRILNWSDEHKAYRKISELKPHPRNEEIYGENEDVSDLVEKLRKPERKLTALSIKEDGTIISGHRRYRACQIVGITEVPVTVTKIQRKRFRRVKIAYTALGTVGK